jgi:hypothetical protein
MVAKPVAGRWTDKELEVEAAAVSEAALEGGPGGGLAIDDPREPESVSPRS